MGAAADACVLRDAVAGIGSVPLGGSGQPGHLCGCHCVCVHTQPHMSHMMCVWLWMVGLCVFWGGGQGEPQHCTAQHVPLQGAGKGCITHLPGVAASAQACVALCERRGVCMRFISFLCCCCCCCGVLPASSKGGPLHLLLHCCMSRGVEAGTRNHPCATWVPGLGPGAGPAATCLHRPLPASLVFVSPAPMWLLARGSGLASGNQGRWTAHVHRLHARCGFWQPFLPLSTTRRALMVDSQWPPGRHTVACVFSVASLCVVASQAGGGVAGRRGGRVSHRCVKTQSACTCV